MTLREVTAGVWMARDPVRIVGTKLSANMTVLRLPGDALLVHSPVALTPERRVAVEAIGEVAHLYAPNTFHDRWIGEWAAAFPRARVHAPSPLAATRRDLRIDRAHDREPEPAFAGVIDEQRFPGFRLHETALVHRPSRSLIVADLAHNVGRPEDAWTKLYTRVMGFYDRVALSRAIRWTAFSDKGATRAGIDALLAQPFDHLLVGHGDPVTTNARASFANVYAWLTTPPRALPARSTRALRGSPCG